MDGYAYVDCAHTGETNMAIDRQLLETAERERCAFLRLYRWSQPTLSLGHFQANIDRSRHASSASLPSVLRASGGGAIVHHHEWTYAIAMPLSRNHIGAATQLYDWVHDALVLGLRSRGWDATKWTTGCATKKNAEFLCFERRSCGDIVCGEFKVIGSAQRRLGTSVLQHGSILCSASSHTPELLGLADLPLALRATDRQTQSSNKIEHEHCEKSVLECETFGKTVLSWLLAPLVVNLGFSPKTLGADLAVNRLAAQPWIGSLCEVRELPHENYFRTQTGLVSTIGTLHQSIGRDTVPSKDFEGK